MQSTQKQIEKAIIGQRLANARESLGLKQRELAIILGYETYAPIKDMETGVTQVKKPIAKLLEAIVGIRERWLFEGEEPMVREPSNVSPGPQTLMRVPVISWVRAGGWSEVDDPLNEVPAMVRAVVNVAALPMVFWFHVGIALATHASVCQISICPLTVPEGIEPALNDPTVMFLTFQLSCESVIEILSALTGVALVG